MLVKTDQHTSEISKLKGINLELLNECEQESIKGGGGRGIITTIHPG